MRVKGRRSFKTMAMPRPEAKTEAEAKAFLMNQSVGWVKLATPNNLKVGWVSIA